MYRKTLLFGFILLAFSFVASIYIFTTAQSAPRRIPSPTPTRTPTATPQPTIGASSTLTTDEIALLIEDVPASTAFRYDAKDSAGNGLDTLKVIKRLDGPGYIGIYHYLSFGTFNLKVAESTDLINWTFLRNLDTDATHGDIIQFPGGDFLVAYEKKSGATSSIRIRQYKNYASLKSGQKLGEKNINRQLSSSNEGTPNFISVNKKAIQNGKQDWSNSTIKLGFHYLLQTDRNATGVLTNFSSWQATENSAANAYFTQAGYGGNYGDRDDFVNGGDYIIYEAQLVRDRWDTWRSVLYDSSANLYQKLDPYTQARSIAFGNATVSKLPLPNGTEGYFVSYFIFSEGASPGEAGALIFYTSADNLSRVTPRSSRPPHNASVFLPTCTCTTPGGSAPNNGFICTDGTSKYCASDEFCTNSSVQPAWPCSKLQ